MSRPIQDRSTDRRARIQKFASTVLSLQALLDTTRDEQFMASGTGVETPEDVGIRSLGLIRNPTATITEDNGRLQLRDAWLRADEVLRDAYEQLNEAGLDLQQAHDRWLGADRSTEAASTNEAAA